MNKIFSLIVGLFSFSCLFSKDVETGIVLNETTEDANPINWDEDSCSYNIGDHICNLRLATAMNTADELYNYHGELLMLEVTSMRCSDCQRSAASNEWLVTMGGNIKWITIIMENEAGMNPSVSDGGRWANAFKLSYFFVWLGSRGDIDIHHGKTGFPYSSYPY